MTDATLASAATSYLAQLEAALAAAVGAGDLAGAVDAVTRDEILAGVREELVGMDDAAAASRIRELGDPEFIAAEARAATVAAASAHGAAPALAAASATKMRQHARREPAWFSVIAGLLVMIGGVIVPVVGAIAGYVMMWFSTTWTRRQKITATLVPLGFAAGVALLTVAASFMPSVPVSSGSGEFQAPQSPLIPAGYDVMWSGILLLFGVNLLVGIWLLVIARRNWVARG